eukprot:6192060-Pleurochrysis_carterae.AAC.2
MQAVGLGNVRITHSEMPKKSHFSPESRTKLMRTPGTTGCSRMPNHALHGKHEEESRVVPDSHTQGSIATMLVANAKAHS